jgi:hypothetical protein
MPRESGAFSIPEQLLLNREAAAYWIARSSRAMTAEHEEGAPTARLLRQPLLQPRLHDPVARELVGAFVLGMACVTFDPVPPHVMGLQRGIQALP